MVSKTITIDACGMDNCTGLKTASCLFCGRDLCDICRSYERTEFTTDSGVGLEVNSMPVCPVCEQTGQGETALECLIATAVESKAGKLCDRQGKIIAQVDTEPDPPEADPSLRATRLAGYVLAFGEAYRMSTGYHQRILLQHLGGDPIEQIEAVAVACGALLDRLSNGARAAYATRGEHDPDAYGH